MKRIKTKIFHFISIAFILRNSINTIKAQTPSPLDSTFGGTCKIITSFTS